MKNPLIKKFVVLLPKKKLDILQKAGINYAGFVLFFQKKVNATSLERAENLVAKLPEDIASVAVMVSPTKEQVGSSRGCRLFGNSDSWQGRGFDYYVLVRFRFLKLLM